MDAFRILLGVSLLLTAAVALAPHAAASPIDCTDAGMAHHTCETVMSGPNCLIENSPGQWSTACRNYDGTLADYALCYLNEATSPAYWQAYCI